MFRLNLCHSPSKVSLISKVVAVFFAFVLAMASFAAKVNFDP